MLCYYATESGTIQKHKMKMNVAGALLYTIMFIAKQTFVDA